MALGARGGMGAARAIRLLKRATLFALTNPAFKVVHSQLLRRVAVE
jgi:hypothetical protein